MPNSSRRITIESLEDRTVPAGLSTPLPGPNSPSSGTGHVHHVAVDLPSTGPDPDLINVSDDANTRLVQKLYFDLLGRSLDAASQGYVDALNNKDSSRREVAESILQSDEYNLRQIDAMYKAFLGRSADTTGLQGYLQSVKDGGSLEDVAVDLLSSDEYRKLHSGDQPFLTALYNDVLGRTPDGVSSLQYGQRLTDAKGVHDVVEEIVTSSEAHKLGGESVVELMLNQKPTADVGANYVNDARSGKPIGEVLADIAASDEYFNIVQVK